MRSRQESQLGRRWLSSRLIKASAQGSRHRHATMLYAFLACSIAIPVFSQGVALAADAIFACILPVILATVLKEGFQRGLWIVASVWALSQVVSDLLHNIPIGSAPTFAGPTIALLSSGLFWARHYFRLTTPGILSAVGIGWSVLEIIIGNAAAQGNVWKYGMAIPISLSVLATAYALDWSKRAVILVLLALASVSLLFDSRFLTGLFLIVAAGLVIAGARSRASRRRASITVVVLLALGAATYAAYPAVALSGIIGERALQQQITYQNEGANYLLATRMEAPQLLSLFVQNPVAGIGSYGDISGKEAYNALQFVNDFVAPLTANDRAYLLSDDLGGSGYHAHSQVLSAALYAGFLALPFWIYLWAGIVRSLRRFVLGRAPVSAILLFMSGLAIWDSLFSPLTNRSHIAISVTVFLVAVVLRGRPEDAAPSFDDHSLNPSAP